MLNKLGWIFTFVVSAVFIYFIVCAFYVIFNGTFDLPTWNWVGW